jgi:hypothetical protein
MRKTSFLLFIGALTIWAQDPDPWQHHPGWIMSAAASGPSRIEVRLAAIAQPPRGDLAALFGLSGVETGPGNVVYRFVIDEARRQYFGYDISTEATSVAGQNRVTIAPLTWTPRDLPARLQISSKGPLTPVLLPKYPEPQIVSESDTIELDLLVSPDSRQKVVDYIQVAKRPEPATATSIAAPRNFTPDDGPVNFDFEHETSVWVNGEKYSRSSWSETKRGATVWFYFPGKGRYILSLVPHEGFSKTGAIRDNVISFEGDGQEYEVRTMKLILGSKGAWNLYVLHDPSYAPKENRQVRFATDRLENLLPKR